MISFRTSLSNVIFGLRFQCSSYDNRAFLGELKGVIQFQCGGTVFEIGFKLSARNAALLVAPGLPPTPAIDRLAAAMERFMIITLVRGRGAVNPATRAGSQRVPKRPVPA